MFQMTSRSSEYWSIFPASFGWTICVAMPKGKRRVVLRSVLPYRCPRRSPLGGWCLVMIATMHSMRSAAQLPPTIWWLRHTVCNFVFSASISIASYARRHLQSSLHFLGNGLWIVVTPWYLHGYMLRVELSRGGSCFQMLVSPPQSSGPNCGATVYLCELFGWLLKVEFMFLRSTNMHDAVSWCIRSTTATVGPPPAHKYRHCSTAASTELSSTLPCLS